MALTEYFIRYLQRRDELPPGDLARLRSIRTVTERFDHGQTIVSAKDPQGRSCMILRGMAGRVHYVPGRVTQRVMTALHVPGEFVDLHHFVLSALDHDVVSVGPSEVEYVDHAELTEITENYPHLARLLWMSTAIDAAIHRRWLLAANALRSSAHLAHLLCDIYTRLASVGAAEGHRMQLPLLQRELADILGYSPIHVNRAVRDLRDRGLVRWTGMNVELVDWDELARLAKFDPVYLDLARHAR